MACMECFGWFRAKKEVRMTTQHTIGHHEVDPLLADEALTDEQVRLLVEHQVSGIVGPLLISASL